VLIAGAGPTGLTLAIDLARRGIEVRIVDKAAEFFAGSRGDGIQPRTLEVFDDLGIIDDVLTHGSPPPIIRAHRGGKFVGELRMSDPKQPSSAIPYPGPWVLGQSQTEAFLRDRLATFGIYVELDTELVGFEHNESDITATLTQGSATETVRAAYLVGADGGTSIVRRSLGIAFEGTTDESIRMLLGDVRADALDHDHGHLFSDADNQMENIVFSPLPGGPYFQFGSRWESDVEPSLGALQHYVEKYSGRTDIRLTDLAWSTVWRPNVRLARYFRDGRVFLAGDAAHVHPPTGGQGLNTGIQDAYNLGWKPADGSPELLDTYEVERRSVAARVLGVSSELLRRYTDSEEDAHRRGEETYQLDISYRDPSSTGRLVAGDRAPDALVADAHDKPVRLFDLFRGPHATLLCFGCAAPAEVAPNGHAWTVRRREAPLRAVSGPFVTDTDGHAFDGYHAADGTRILVRPDGYVAWKDTSAGPEQ
jgi:2-polyprenyl-6-methoxyphenol hydroxylase-like FAD-dependent oxidoreductase